MVFYLWLYHIMSSNNEPAQSRTSYFKLNEFLSNVKHYKNTFKGEIQWCNNLSLNDWKTHYLQITSTGALTHSIDELTADSTNIQPLSNIYSNVESRLLRISIPLLRILMQIVIL